MANEQNNDLMRMQQEAIRRVQEMQSRAQQTLNNSVKENRAEPSFPNFTSPRPSPPAHHEPIRQEVQQEPEPLHLPQPNCVQNQINPISDIFDKLLQDHERSLILILILLLVDEKADTGLILALMYLIL